VCPKTFSRPFLALLECCAAVAAVAVAYALRRPFSDL